jgi:hypothetical protein
MTTQIAESTRSIRTSLFVTVFEQGHERRDGILQQTVQVHAVKRSVANLYGEKTTQQRNSTNTRKSSA